MKDSEWLRAPLDTQTASTLLLLQMIIFVLMLNDVYNGCFDGFAICCSSSGQLGHRMENCFSFDRSTLLLKLCNHQ